jgi:hypothetical protein
MMGATESLPQDDTTKETPESRYLPKSNPSASYSTVDKTTNERYITISTSGPNYTYYSNTFKQKIMLSFPTNLIAKLSSTEQAESNFIEANNLVIKDVLNEVSKQCITFYEDKKNIPDKIDAQYLPRARGHYGSFKHTKQGEETTFVIKNEELKSSSTKKECYDKIIEAVICDIVRDALNMEHDGFFIGLVIKNDAPVHFGSSREKNGKLENQIQLSLNEIVNLKNMTINRNLIKDKVNQETAKR